MKRAASLVILALLAGFVSPAQAQPATTQQSDPAQLAQTTAQLAQTTIDKALAYLKSKQKPDFGWQESYDPPAITALVLRAFMADSNYDADMPFLDKGYDKLLSYQIDSGGIYKDTLACYNTAIAISALADANEAEYRAPMQKALDYLRTLQWSDSIAGVPDQLRVKSKDDVKFGGFGYGKRSRPDLSNTQMALDALHDAGVKPTDPAFAAALIFVSRCQNFSETNNQPWAGDDGGFIYTPANNGNSPAGEYNGPDGKRLLRSYGSMTYAGFKSMIYAGLTHDDPRVKAAWNWISSNYSIDENPGISAQGPAYAQAGVFYYYYTMSRALIAYGQNAITDSHGVPHDWRLALIQKLATLQQPDGSFVGQKNWMENNPILATSYTVMVLETAKKDLAARPPN